ncbi:hypothetical protein CVD25_08450 [Bacillus canaveralius]|uniref:Spore coat protein n=1 Tax=Bacillus canaveralius TaxID=1403243 RepID=A0A2N5GIC3_9BACI|nr:hypothetical protein [Bacillus canaveralius]PLR80735.1 hypothetical protein CU635_16920 [Bacillus canaveralius]PLR98387.1 hypothetical protein CVD25_08450 [Bacillus canaveralius]
MGYGKKSYFHDDDWGHKKDCGHKKDHDCGCKDDDDKCKIKSCICKEFRRITPGTTVFLTIDGVPSGPYVFAKFCKDDHCVTLITGAGVTPSGAVFIVDCFRIDAFAFPPTV